MFLGVIINIIDVQTSVLLEVSELNFVKLLIEKSRLLSDGIWSRFSRIHVGLVQVTPRLRGIEHIIGLAPIQLIQFI
jgi:hypothetical protein